ncbi:Aldo/keto reductase [Phlegmacium glaucopus]|nr:Aldo/keto reductase [Phlegmacium glaucopus]
MGLSASYYIKSDEERFKVLDAALQEGCTFLDTADAYGDNEELLGKWCNRTGRRDKIFLSTKRAFPYPLHISVFILLIFRDEISREHIDKFPSARCDVGACQVTNRSDQQNDLKVSVSKGKENRHLFRRAYAIAAVQVEYSPFRLELLGACQELGVAIIPYAPLGRGMLTGIYQRNTVLLLDKLPSWHGSILKEAISFLSMEPGNQVSERISGAVKVKLSEKGVEEIREKAEKAS